MIIEGMHYNENCECEGCKRVSGKSKKIGGTSIAQALAEERERVRGVIEERKIPEITDPKYFEKDGIGKTLLLKMTHNTAYNYGLKHGYNQALCYLLSILDKPLTDKEDI